MNDTQQPARVFENHHTVIAASQLRKGDATKHGIVARVENKRTKTHVTFEDATTRPFEQNENVPVDRAVETEASQEAQRAWYVERRSEEYLLGLAPAAQTARAELAASLTNSSRVNSDLVASAVFAGYLDERTRAAADRAAEGKFTWTEAARLISEQFRDELVDDRSSQWSGGFSYRNAEEQMQREAKQRFVRDVKWWLS
jgi:ethanolamine ammonia-lyase large subunit